MFIISQKPDETILGTDHIAIENYEIHENRWKNIGIKISGKNSRLNSLSFVNQNSYNKMLEMNFSSKQFANKS